MTVIGTAPAALGNRRQRYRAPDLAAFATLTPASEYWLGFLMADGCVSGGRETILVLHRRDADHVRAFARFVGCDDRPLAPVNRGNGVRLAIGSVALAEQLADVGVVAGRGRDHDLPVRADLAASRDFWRGVIDGDGTVKVDAGGGIPQVQLVARPALAHQFAEFLAPSVGFLPRLHRHSQSDRILMVSVGGRTAKAATIALYGENDAPALARKAERAAAVMSWNPKVMSRYPWEMWADGKEWTLHRGVDYAEAHRVWEAGRRHARGRGLRLELTDEGAHLRLRFVRRT